MRARRLHAGSVAVLVAAGLMLAPGASAATTRFVDDDHKQCPQATFTKIQAAIDASAGHDLVRVCAGRYPEQLTLPASKPALYVDSFPAGAATITAPATGLVAVPGSGTRDAQLNMIRMLGAQQHVVGLDVAGPLRPRTAADGCATSSAIEVFGDDAVVDGNVLSGLSDNACAAPSDYHFDTSGVRLEDARGVVERNTITGAAIGIALSSGNDIDESDGLVETNVIVGRGLGSGSVGISTYFGGGSVRSNDISANDVGLPLSFPSGLAKGNLVHDNTTGIAIEDGSTWTVDSNILRDNAGDGLFVGGSGHFGLGSSGTIRGNDVRRSGHDGIAVYGCGTDCFPASTSFTLTGNVSLGNAHLDCYDLAPPNDVWSANIGVTDSPSTLCSPH